MASATVTVNLTEAWTAVGADKAYVGVQLKSVGSAGVDVRVQSTADPAPTDPGGIHLDDDSVQFVDFSGMATGNTVYARATRGTATVTVVTVDVAV